jgi:hypothetical protein
MEISQFRRFLPKRAWRRSHSGGPQSGSATARWRLPAWLALSLVAHLAAAGGGEAPPPLPIWQTLEFEQTAYWVTARSSVTLNPCPDNPQDWQLTATSSVASNAEEVQLTLDANSGRALFRSRLSQGKQQRYKTYQFLPEHILRERREPGSDPGEAPAQWPLSSSRKTPYPALAANLVITDAYALLELAGRFQQSADDSAEVVVNTDANFYRVRMTRGNHSTIRVDFHIHGEPGPATGKRDASEVLLSVIPLGDTPDKPDFSLLGLQGEITLLFDPAGLPLQLRGSAPRVGRTEINLKAVTLREPAA